VESDGDVDLGGRIVVGCQEGLVVSLVLLYLFVSPAFLGKNGGKGPTYRPPQQKPTATTFPLDHQLGTRAESLGERAYVEGSALTS
jgi:hypothetical protein